VWDPGLRDCACTALWLSCSLIRNADVGEELTLRRFLFLADELQLGDVSRSVLLVEDAISSNWFAYPY
jgi:hypothetical protein